MGSLRTWLPTCVALSIPASMSGQTPPLGPEFPINTYTTGLQSEPRVAVAKDGGFIAVWNDYPQGGGRTGIFARRYNALGGKIGTEFQVNTYTGSYQYFPAVAVGTAGDFVVAWQSDAQDGSLDGIFGQRFDGSGAKVGPEFQVNTHTSDNQRNPRLAMDGSGNFVVVWTSYGGADSEIFGQRFDSTGTKIGTEFRVNTYTSGRQLNADVAMDPTGEFVVVWQSAAQDGSGYGIFGQRFGAAGAKTGAEFLVNDYTTEGQMLPSVSMARAGQFVVVWNSNGQDGSGYGVFGRRFGSSGEKLGMEFQVNEVVPGGQREPAVAMEASGRFVVAWVSDGQDGSEAGIFARRFDIRGAPVENEFPVNSYTTGSQDQPAIGVDREGNLVFLWRSVGQDGSGSGIFGTRSNLSPEPMQVDVHGGAGSVSDLDGVLEPGETAEIEPSWKILAGDGGPIPHPVALTGAASNLLGPLAGSIEDPAADYGLISPGATGDCYDNTLGHDCYLIHVNIPAARPATHLDMQFDESPSSGGLTTRILHVGDSFADVPRTQPFYRKIETLLHSGITAGCSATEYCPGDSVSRGQMAIFVAKGVAGSGEYVPTIGAFNGQNYDCSPGGISRFSDVSVTDPFCRHVHYIAAQNVTVGCSAAEYCPGETVTRDAMASFIAKAIVAPKGAAGVPMSYGPDPTTGLSYSCFLGSPNTHFTDVPASNPFCRHIHYLWAKGIVGGCSATQYCPSQNVTRDAMAKFLANAFELQLYGP